MRRRRLLPALVLCLALAAPAAAQDRTVCWSLPLNGDASFQSIDMVRAMRMALEESGRTDVRYVSLDIATRSTGTWEPGRVSANARRAASDDSAVAYLAEFTFGATAESLPILSEAEILQISPSNTYVGLTRPEGERDEPGRYHPSARRTFGRVIPADPTQAQAVFFNRFETRCGKAPEPHAIYGYEAMALAPEALARGGNTRAGAIGGLFATRDGPRSSAPTRSIRTATRRWPTSASTASGAGARWASRRSSPPGRRWRGYTRQR